MNLQKNTILMAILMIALHSFAQEKSSYKFGKITAEDLQTNIYSIDSNANAVVLADIGSSEFEGNNKGWFSLIHKRHSRIHILNKNGYNAADIEIYLIRIMEWKKNSGI